MDIEDLNWVTREVGALMLLAAGRLEELTGLDRAELMGYALLVVVTGQTIDQAAAHLRETGTVGYAMGRVLVGAAEVSFRESGDAPESIYP